MSSISAISLERSGKQAVANLYEGSGRQGALSHKFQCLGGQPHLNGRAFPLVCPAASNIWIHKALYLAEPEDVLVISTLGRQNHAYIGDLLVEAAVHQKLGGIVLEGCIRDVENLKSMPLPIYAFGTAVNGPVKTGEGGSLGEPIKFGNINISKGDLIRGDADGVVVVPADKLDGTLNEAEAREKREEAIRKQLFAKGIPLYKILNLTLP